MARYGKIQVGDIVLTKRGNFLVSDIDHSRRSSEWAEDEVYVLMGEQEVDDIRLSRSELTEILIRSVFTFGGRSYIQYFNFIQHFKNRKRRLANGKRHTV